MHDGLQRALAVLFSLLLVSTATVGPALAGQVFERLSDGGGELPDAGPPGGQGHQGGGLDGPAGSGQGGPGDGRGGPPDGSDPGDDPGNETDTGGSGNGNDGPADGGGGPPGGAGPTTPDAGTPPTDAPDDGNDGGNDPSGPPADAPGNGNAGEDGGPPTDAPGNGDGASGGGPPTRSVSTGDVDLGPNASALAHRLAAYRLLANATGSGPGNAGAARKQRLLGVLNGTFQYHLDAHRATSARLFEDDVRVAAPLHRRAPNVTRHLVVSDRKLAATAIEDVRRTRAALRARNVTFDEAAVADNLSAARDAYDEGRSLPEQARHARIQHYRQAWTHAQRAIDVMDEAVEPVVTIHTRRDVPHEGTLVHPVDATVFDVRPWELGTAIEVTNATADGTTETTVSVALDAETIPATVATVDATVNLTAQLPADDRAYVLNLTARDPGDDVADRGDDEGDALDIHHPRPGATP